MDPEVRMGGEKDDEALSYGACSIANANIDQDSEIRAREVDFRYAGDRAAGRLAHL